MLKNVNEGDKVVAFPYGNGTVIHIENDCGFNIQVNFENIRGITHCHTFSEEGKSSHWPTVSSCWSIKNAPSWVWEYFKRPNVAEPFEIRMNVENLINIDRIGRQLTPAQSSAIAAQLERIPAMERTLQRKDHDFAELSVAYFSARAECERLKEAVRWMFETMDTKHVVVSYASYSSAIRGLDGAGSLSSVRDSARKAVEELL